MCRGPHLPNLLYQGSKILSAAGAYWRGDEKDLNLRVFTVSPSEKKMLDKYLVIEEAKKRDHRKIGGTQLFHFHRLLVPGLPLWLPKGTQLRLRLEWKKIGENLITIN